MTDRARPTLAVGTSQGNIINAHANGSVKQKATLPREAEVTAAVTSGVVQAAIKTDQPSRPATAPTRVVEHRRQEQDAHTTVAKSAISTPNTNAARLTDRAAPLSPAVPKHYIFKRITAHVPGLDEVAESDRPRTTGVGRVRKDPLRAADGIVPGLTGDVATPKFARKMIGKSDAVNGAYPGAGQPLPVAPRAYGSAIRGLGHGYFPAPCDKPWSNGSLQGVKEAGELREKFYKEESARKVTVKKLSKDELDKITERLSTPRKQEAPKAVASKPSSLTQDERSEARARLYKKKELPEPKPSYVSVKRTAAQQMDHVDKLYKWERKRVTDSYSVRYANDTDSVQDE